MATVNVQEFIDRRKLSRFQLRVFALCALIVLVDGFDTQAIGYVAPAIVRSWHVDRAALTPVFSAGLFGLMLGALAFGPIADRFGRSCGSGSTNARMSVLAAAFSSPAGWKG